MKAKLFFNVCFCVFLSVACSVLSGCPTGHVVEEGEGEIVVEGEPLEGEISEGEIVVPEEGEGEGEDVVEGEGEGEDPEGEDPEGEGEGEDVVEEGEGEGEVIVDEGEGEGEGVVIGEEGEGEGEGEDPEGEGEGEDPEGEGEGEDPEGEGEGEDPEGEEVKTWQMIYSEGDDDFANSVEQTSDGGYIVGGYVLTDTYHAYLLKIDSDGVREWSMMYGGSENSSFAYSVQQTSDGGYVLGGRIRDIDFDENMYLLKIDSFGVEEWSATYGGVNNERINSIYQTNDNGYVLGGTTRSFGSGGSDMYLVKVDSLGVEEWSVAYGGAGDDKGNSVQQTSDGGFVLAGSTFNVSSNERDMRLLKVDSIGIEVWSVAYGGAGDDKANAVQQTSDGGFVLAGSTSSFGSGGSDMYLVQVDSLGVEEWSVVYGGNDDEYARSVRQTSNGGYVLGGLTYNSDFTEGYLYILKIDSFGIEEWGIAHHVSSYNFANSVQQTSDGGYVLSGGTSDSGSGYRIYLVKTDSEGNTAPYPE